VTTHIDPSALRDALARLRSGAPDAGLVPALRAVCTAAAELFAIDGAGLLTVDAEEVLRAIAASNDDASWMERAHERTGEGPCVDAITFDAVIQSPDVQSDARWPSLAAELSEAPIRAVLGVPVHVGGAAIGSLNVYRRDVYDWDESDVEAVRAFSGVVEHLLATALLAESREAVIGQLRHALESRVVIERAVGVLMGQRRVEAATAFQELRADARAQRRKVADVAAEILAGLAPDAEPPTHSVV
jgi:GAF domain-containing protein